MHYGAYVRSFGPELLSFNEVVSPALCLGMRIYSFELTMSAELVSIVNKCIGLRHVFLGNIFWCANKENTAIFLPNSILYSLDSKFASLYIVLSAHQCMHISVNNSALNTLSFGISA